jgi:hypothetical protein
MIRTIAAAVLAMFVATAAPSLALSKDEKSPNECGKYLTEMSNALDTLDALVPNVPPDEARYLEKEDAAAVQSGAGKRIFDVEHRALYAAWHLHNEFYWARQEVKTNQPLTSLPDLKSNLKFAIGMAAHIPHPMANAKIAWDEFYNADHGQILTLEQVRLGAEEVRISDRSAGPLYYVSRQPHPRQRNQPLGAVHCEATNYRPRRPAGIFATAPASRRTGRAPSRAIAAPHLEDFSNPLRT